MPPGRLHRGLDRLERAGNVVGPLTVLVLAAGLVLVASAIAAALGAQVAHPRDGEAIAAVSLLDGAGLRRLFTEALVNFIAFMPLGVVVAITFGLGLAEHSGLLGALVRAGVGRDSPRALTVAIFAIAVVGPTPIITIVVLPPLAAWWFAAVGRHPLAGLAAAFAGVSGSVSARLLPGASDVHLAGFAQSSLSVAGLLPGYHVEPSGTYYVTALAAVVLVALGTWVTHRVVEPRLGPWTGDGRVLPAPLEAAERRGLHAAAIAALLTITALVLLALPGAPLRGISGSLVDQLAPLFDAGSVISMLLFLVPGAAYGLAAGTIRSDRDVARLLADSLGRLGLFIALAFVAAQLTRWITWSNLGDLGVVATAQALRAAELSGPWLILAVVVATFVLGLFVPLASAKWSLLAPVLVPWFVAVGFTPETALVAYRIGDAPASALALPMTFMPFVMACVCRHVPGAGFGTLAALVVPYAVVFTLAWTLLLLALWLLGLPIGPGVFVRLG